MFERVISFLETTLFTFNEQPITLWAILMVPTWVIVALWLSKILIKNRYVKNVFIRERSKRHSFG